MRAALTAALIVSLVGPLSAERDDFKKAETKLKEVIAAGNQKQLVTAVKDVAVFDTPDAMKVLLNIAKQQPPGSDSWFWMEAYTLLLRAAAGMWNAAALDEAAEFILEKKSQPISRDLLAMMCNQGRAEIVAPMCKILERGPDDMKLLAAEHLISIGDKRAVEPLIKSLKDSKASNDLRKKVSSALIHITGQNFGDNASNWEGWWAANRDKDLDRTRGSGGGGGGTVTLDPGRGSEWENLKKDAKVLILGSGQTEKEAKCKCGKPHDLDKITETCDKLGLKWDYKDKVAFEKDDFKLEDYIAILGVCTHIREHCACPLCKPGTYSGDRLFQ